MRFIVTNQKGGVGKTTLVFHLASLFASDGKSVLVVDLDPQANLTSCFLRGELPPEHNVGLVFQGRQPTPMLVGDHLDLVGADASLGRFDDHGAGRGLRLIDAWLEGLGGYDAVFFDTPPAMGLFTRNALFASDYALIPADVSWFAFKGLADLVASLEDLWATHQAKVRPLGIILNSMQERQAFAQETWAALDNAYGRLLFKAAIPESVRVREAASQGVPVTSLAPRSKPAAAYRDLYREILQRLEAPAL